MGLILTQHRLFTAQAALSAAQAIVDGFKGTLELANLALEAAAYTVQLSKASLDAANFVLEGAKTVLQQKEILLLAAEGALEVVKAVVDKSRVALTIANGILEAAKGVIEVTKITVKAGLDAASAIARFGLGGVIDVRSASFDVLLSVASGGYLRASITVQLMGGAPITFGIDVNFKDLWSMALSLAEKAFDGISDLV